MDEIGTAVVAALIAELQPIAELHDQRAEDPRDPLLEARRLFDTLWAHLPPGSRPASRAWTKPAQPLADASPDEVAARAITFLRQLGTRHAHPLPGTPLSANDWAALEAARMRARSEARRGMLEHGVRERGGDLALPKAEREAHYREVMRLIKLVEELDVVIAHWAAGDDILSRLIDVTGGLGASHPPSETA